MATYKVDISATVTVSIAITAERPHEAVFRAYDQKENIQRQLRVGKADEFKKLLRDSVDSSDERDLNLQVIQIWNLQTGENLRKSDT